MIFAGTESISTDEASINPTSAKRVTLAIKPENARLRRKFDLTDSCEGYLNAVQARASRRCEILNHRLKSIDVHKFSDAIVPIVELRECAMVTHLFHSY